MDAFIALEVAILVQLEPESTVQNVLPAYAPVPIAPAFCLFI